MTDATATTEPKRWGLPDEELATLDAAFPAGAVRGARYPEAYMPSLGR